MLQDDVLKEEITPSRSAGGIKDGEKQKDRKTICKRSRIDPYAG